MSSYRGITNSISAGKNPVKGFRKTNIGFGDIKN